MHVDTTTSSDPAGAAQVGVDAPDLRVFVFALFFIFGGITSLNDVIIPKLKDLFTLNYTQAMLVQFCFFTAYLVIGIPGAQLVKRIGYMRGAAVGLATMMIGCLLFIPASRLATYGLFLTALFVLAAGVVVVQIVANPLISLLGPPRTAHSRLTFAQAFNSLGTTVFPYFGAIIILGTLSSVSAADLSGPALDAYRTAESGAIVRGYLGLAVALAVVAGVVWLFRNRLAHDATSTGDKPVVTGPRYLIGVGIVVVGAIVALQVKGWVGLLVILLAPAVWLYGNDLLKRPRFAFGALCIFLYVGAEVSVGSLIVNYLRQPDVLNLDATAAGKMIPYYWGGAMIGRFAGSALLRVVSPGKVLAGVALGAMALILVSTNTTGAVAGYTLLAVGLANSIMFPTIFSLASEGLGTRTADGSGIINVAIFGGAVIPLLTGSLADAATLPLALLLPVACYAVIFAYGVFARKPAV